MEQSSTLDILEQSHLTVLISPKLYIDVSYACEAHCKRDNWINFQGEDDSGRLMNESMWDPLSGVIEPNLEREGWLLIPLHVRYDEKSQRLGFIGRLTPDS